MKYLKYLKVLLRHKWFTLQECRALGIFWLGIIHDWSKFLPSEWGPYAEWFHGERIVYHHLKGLKRGDFLAGYGRDGEPQDLIVVSYDSDSKRLECLPWSAKEAFDAAWNHHQKSNKHHWQFYLLTQDDDPDLVLPMPDRYRREMLADWRGASRAYTSSDNTREWYLKRRDKMIKRLHPETRAWIEDFLGLREEEELGIN